MTNSATGVTGTLQTVQTGDGTDTPLQISQTEINISGSLTVNGAPISFTNTGSFATTGSNVFVGNQIITGSVNITGQYLVNGVAFSGGTNGTSGTSGSSGSDGSSGTSGSSGSDGSSGTSGSSGIDGSSGTSGSSGTQGSSGSSGTSGQNGISAGRTYYFNQSETSDVAGYKVLSETPTTGTTQTVTKTLTNTQQNVLVESYITPELGFSLIPAGVQRFHLHLLKPASNDDIDVYVTLQLANSTGGTIGSLITSSANIITWNSGNPAEVYVDVVFTSTPIDPTNRFIVKIYLNNNDSTTHNVNYYTEGTEYSYVITSVGVVAGSSGTSGTSGSSGTSPANLDRNGLITTGSAATTQAITGSLILSGSAGIEIDVKGDATITGSLTEVGDVYIFNPASNNSTIKLNISGSNSATGSNLIFGNTDVVTTQSGSVVISGSNNILLNGFRASTIQNGTYGYIGGSSNIVVERYRS